MTIACTQQATVLDINSSIVEVRVDLTAPEATFTVSRLAAHGTDPCVKSTACHFPTKLRTLEEPAVFIIICCLPSRVTFGPKAESTPARARMEGLVPLSTGQAIGQ